MGNFLAEMRPTLGLLKISEIVVLHHLLCLYKLLPK